MTASKSEPLGSVALAAEIVAAYVANNHVQVSELPNLLTSVHGALAKIDDGRKMPETQEPVIPAVSVRRSVTPDYLICLEDGKKFKSLRRHLAGLGMTPEQYRIKWNLPAEYPMVAPNYAATRSALAKKTGFGENQRKKA